MPTPFPSALDCVGGSSEVYYSQVDVESFLTKLCMLWLFNLHDGAFIYTYSLFSSQLNIKGFTQRHYGEVFATELAGDGDFLPQGPASLGNHMMCSCRGVMAHLTRRMYKKLKMYNVGDCFI